MKKLLALIFVSVFAFTFCSDDSSDDPTPVDNSISSIKVTVSFNDPQQLKSDLPMTLETPMDYSIALKKATLIGTGSSQDFVLLEENTLANSQVFEFTSDNVKTLLTNAAIPEGTYSSIRMEVYYLQMRINIATTNRGVEERNIRIYLSNSYDTEGGDFLPGDMTQYGDDGSFHGWLLGEGQVPDMDPVTPRTSAYTENGDGVNWYHFDGKPGNMYGPFGDIDFMNNEPHPIFWKDFDFNFSTANGGDILIDFNVTNCWQFQDKSGDGVFGAADLDPLDPTLWHMEYPSVTITIE